VNLDKSIGFEALKEFAASNGNKLTRYNLKPNRMTIKMSDLKNVLVPDVGGEEVEVIEICVAVGDTLERRGMLLLRSKATKLVWILLLPFAGQ